MGDRDLQYRRVRHADEVPRVRRAMENIQTFAETVGTWADQTFTGNKDNGRVINSIAFETLSVINAYLSTLDKFTEMAGDT